MMKPFGAAEIPNSCSGKPGRIRPVIDHGRCEAKADCVAVCPYGVFEVRRIDPQDYVSLGWLSKIKVKVHGMKSAYTPNADACQACNLCVTACPEKAIRLVAVEVRTEL